MSTTKRPIPNVPAIARIFNAIGGLVLLGAVAAGVGFAMQYKTSAGISSLLLPACGCLVFVGGFYLGVAEVIQLVARIAIEAERSADASERAAEAQRNQRLFLYLVGNEVRGPVSLDMLRSLRAVKAEMRQISGESLVCRVGESDWKRLADFMDKSA